VCACATHQEREEGHRFRSCASFSISVLKVWELEIFRQNDGCLNFVDENDEVLISGFGRRGKAKGDIPGVRFKVVKVSGVGLLALWKEKKVRGARFSSSSQLLKYLLGSQEKPRS
jgi:ribosomal protein S12